MRKENLRFLSLVLLLAFFISLTGTPCFSAAIKKAEDQKNYIKWLESRSMLFQADKLAKKFSGKADQWSHPYAMPQPKQACATASVWFTAYPAATITRQDESVLKTLGSEELWKVFEEIGIQGIHTGPMSRAGGVIGRKYTPTVDGGFDRAGYEIDPSFGTDEEFIKMSKTAQTHDAFVISDVIPGHTGKGPDFRLAERNYKDYPGIYHIVEIAPADWDLLPNVQKGRDSANLSVVQVEKLKRKGYIIGRLQRVIFYEPGVKETNWSATAEVTGADGVKRRWVYLHYFKEGQPTLNWLDPTFAAQRLLTGDIIKNISIFKSKFLRLDANGFLGIEIAPGQDKAWSEGHPLSINACETLAMMTRKLGGFTFQELNLTLEDLCRFTRGGTDLSYDFITRPAYMHALATGNAEFLRLMLMLMRDYDIAPVSLIHALQNHDEITYELVHFTSHPDRPFPYKGRVRNGAQIKEIVLKEAVEAVAGDKAPYNKNSWNGFNTTLTGWCAGAFGVADPLKMTPEQAELVKRGHLLMAMFNAMQPGVFALSGWDLVGALPLYPDQVKAIASDGDNRWLNRGAYDLMGVNSKAAASKDRIPKAVALYGSLPDQLKDEDSFVSNLKRMLKLRQDLKLYIADMIAVPEVTNEGTVIMVNRLPGNCGIEITALNFGRKPVQEVVRLDEFNGKQAITLMEGGKFVNSCQKISENCDFVINLNPIDGKIIVVK